MAFYEKSDSLKKEWERIKKKEKICKWVVHICSWKNGIKEHFLISEAIINHKQIFQIRNTW